MSDLCDMRDLLRDVLGAVFYLAGRDDLDLRGRGGSHPIRAEGEGDLGDAADGPVSDQVRVGRGVQHAGLQICSRDRQIKRRSRSVV